jgi:hypothetical protein
LVYGSDAVTDPRNISVKALHSLIEMPITTTSRALPTPDWVLLISALPT